MEQSKIELFIGTMNEKFNPTDIPLIISQLEKIDNSKFSLIQAADYKNPTTILIFSLFLGFLGVDRFILGQVFLGILKLITIGGLGIWTFIDWFLIMKATRNRNLNKFNAQIAILS
jgi:TM2 domain-containing membrane protein YozV